MTNQPKEGIQPEQDGQYESDYNITNQTKDQATKRPWRLWEESQNFIIADANKGKEFVIGEIYDNKNYIERNDHEVIPNKEQGLANARLIVKAVNSFDLSVKAFNDILFSNNIEEIKGYANKMVQLLQDNKDS